ncbi:MAG TPA: PPOX class F420-dependent oxidoreductase [Frankiaceae bacterium]|nr:PPOX class F420-dependent oxidoreductase [Frankiaceae bacterium]
MDLGDARAYIREHHRGVLATVRKDGSPQLTPVSVGVDDAGLVVISSRETAFKVKHIRRTGQASVCVVPDGFFGEWIYVEGTATIQSLPDAMDGLIAYYRDISGEHPDWDEYRAAMIKDQRCLIRIDPTRAGPDQHG